MQRLEPSSRRGQRSGRADHTHMLHGQRNPAPRALQRAFDGRPHPPHSQACPQVYHHAITAGPFPGEQARQRTFDGGLPRTQLRLHVLVRNQRAQLHDALVRHLLRPAQQTMRLYFQTVIRAGFGGLPFAWRGAVAASDVAGVRLQLISARVQWKQCATWGW